MENNPSDFQIFIKPAGARCNLGCHYCYYLGKRDIYPHGTEWLMTDENLERTIIQHFIAARGNVVNFTWHGGEPLVAGIGFYKRAVAYQKKHNHSGITYTNGIQTNGTLLTDEWCRFLASEYFTVGISLDGPQALHDRFRKNSVGEPTFTNVLKGFSLLIKHGIIPEILCVVNSENVKQPLEVYNFFRKLGAGFITFLPLVERDPGSPSGVSERTVPAEAFGSFLTTIFYEWVEKDIGNIKVQVFEEAVRTAFNQEHSLCIFKETCGAVPVLERNGDFYSCDHYVDKQHLIGNISDHSIAEMLANERQLAFGKAKSDLPAYCLKCEVRQMCNGECPKNRFVFTPDGEPGLNYLCAGYKYFFNHCSPFVEAVRQMWKTSV
jgi:uncharacterized protein